MKRLALLLPVLALVACHRDNGASVEVQGICSVPDSCSFSGSCDAYILSNPRIDPTLTPVLMLPLQVENQLPDNAVKESGKLNTNDAHVDGAIVEYSGALAGQVSVLAQGYVPANGTAVVAVDVIPVGVGSGLSGPAYPQYSIVSAKVRLRGYLDDGTRFETAAFPIPVEVATGSVVACGAGKLACPTNGQYPHGCATAP